MRKPVKTRLTIRKSGKVEIETKDTGTPVETFSRVDGGRLFFMIRCTDKATWQAAGVQFKLLEQGRDKVSKPARGISVAEIGAVQIVPPVMDKKGNIVTPAVVDSRYHVNVLVDPSVLARVDPDGYERWKLTATAFMSGTDAPANNLEVSKRLQGVELIDPTTVATPANVFL